MSGFVPKRTFKIVRYVKVDQKTLREIAKLLGIPPEEEKDLWSGEIHIVPKNVHDEKS